MYHGTQTGPLSERAPDPALRGAGSLAGSRAALDDLTETRAGVSDVKEHLIDAAPFLVLPDAEQDLSPPHDLLRLLMHCSGWPRWVGPVREAEAKGCTPRGTG